MRYTLRTKDGRGRWRTVARFETRRDAEQAGAGIYRWRTWAVFAGRKKVTETQEGRVRRFLTAEQAAMQAESEARARAHAEARRTRLQKRRD